MTDRREDQLPEHETRPETTVGGGIAGEGGTARETAADQRAAEAGFDEDDRQPRSDANDDDPEDPNGPEVAFQPRPL